MHKLPLFLSILILAALLTGCGGNAVAQANEVSPIGLPEKVEPTAVPEVVSQIPPASCPVTSPQDPPFLPPAPYDALGFKDHFWFGSNSLWTTIPANGVWGDLPDNPDGYTQKILWWREGYVWTEEPEPNLVVAGERLDAQALPLNVSRATNAYASDIGSAMLVGVDFPTLGCWKITGKYRNNELSFVVWVAP